MSSDITAILKQINDYVTRFGLVDISLVILVLVGLLRGYRKGFTILLGNLIQMVFAVTITLEYSDKIAAIFSIQSAIGAAIVRACVFLTLVVICHYISKMILQGIAKVVTIQFTEIIDKIVGAISGALFFILLLSFIVHFGMMFSTKAFKETFEKSNLSGAFLEEVAPAVHQVVRRIIPEPLRDVKFEKAVPKKK